MNKGAQVPPGVQLTAEEVAKHNRKSDCWTILNGMVYDVTLYMDYHPGGKGNLMKGAGKDCTEMYNESHPWVSADALLSKCVLGRLVGPPLPPPKPREPRRPKAPAIEQQQPTTPLEQHSPSLGKQQPAMPLGTGVCGTTPERG